MRGSARTYLSDITAGRPSGASRTGAEGQAQDEQRDAREHNDAESDQPMFGALPIAARGFG